MTVARRYRSSVNVPFTGLLPEILDLTKLMTTRVDVNNYYYETFIYYDPARSDRIYPLMHMFWQSGRTRHPEFYKIGIVEWRAVCRKLGRDFTKADAVRDGFDTIDQYIEALGITNHMSYWEVLDHKWTQLLWEKDGWLEGPFKPPEGNPARKLLW